MNTLLAASLAHLTQLLGGNLGAAILGLSLAVRLVCVPLTLTVARRTLRRQKILRDLQPEIELLKKRYEKKPEKMFAELRELYRKHHCSPFDLVTLLGGLIQLPIFAMLYGAVRSVLRPTVGFLWIRNLATPDGILISLILLLTGVAAYFSPGITEQARTTIVVVQTIVTAVIVWKLAAGLGLYWIASGVVGLLQNLWLRRSPSIPNPA